MSRYTGRIYIFFTLLVIILVCIVGAKIEHQKIHQQLSQGLKELSDIINLDFLVRYSRLAASLSKSQLIKAICQEDTPLTRNRALDLLTGIASGAEADLVYILDKNGNVIISTLLGDGTNIEGVNYQFRSYYQKAIAGRTIIYPALSTVSQKRGLYFSSPIFAEGQKSPLGVVVIRHGLEQLDDKLRQYPYNYAIISSCAISKISVM